MGALDGAGCRGFDAPWIFAKMDGRRPWRGQLRGS